ncbi:MAG: hypothetical protein ABR583_06325 [Gaiellaceae bacterium]
MTAKRGTTVKYTLTYTNAGPAHSERAQVADVLPAGLDFVSASLGGTYNRATRTVTWNLGTVPNGSTGTLELIVSVAPTVKVGTVLVNKAAFTGDLTVSTRAAWALTVVP